MPPKECNHEDVVVEDGDSTGFCCVCNKWLEGSPGAWTLSKDFNSSSDDDDDGADEVPADEDDAVVLDEGGEEEECDCSGDIDVLDPTRPNDGSCRRCGADHRLNDDESWEKCQ